jgi:hypothetical protein
MNATTKSAIGKFIKGTAGGALTVAAALIATGQPMSWKPLCIAIGTGAFHGGYKILKEMGWIPA